MSFGEPIILKKACLLFWRATVRRSCFTCPPLPLIAASASGIDHRVALLLFSALWGNFLLQTSPLSQSFSNWKSSFPPFLLMVLDPAAIFHQTDHWTNRESLGCLAFLFNSYPRYIHTLFTWLTLSYKASLQVSRNDDDDVKKQLFRIYSYIETRSFDKNSGAFISD